MADINPCEICGDPASVDDDVPECAADDGRAGRFCASCRVGLIEDWPHEDCEETELAQCAEWREQRKA